MKLQDMKLQDMKMLDMKMQDMNMTEQKQDSWAVAKKTARCAQYMGALKSYESLHYAPVYFSRNL